MTERVLIQVDGITWSVKPEDVAKLHAPGNGFGTSLLAAIAETGCPQRGCKNLTAALDKDTGELEYSHGEGLRCWPHSRYGQGLTNDLIDWFREIHAYEASLHA